MKTNNNEIKNIFGKFSGFSIIGGVVTILSIGFLYIFNECLDFYPTVSYLLSYLITIFVSYILNTIFLFKTRVNLKKMLYYSLTYLSGMGIGTFLLKILILFIENVNETILSVFVIPITMIWNFYFVNIILGKKGSIL